MTDNILMPWSKPYLSKVWVADNAFLVRYSALSKRPVAAISTAIANKEDVDDNKDWLYQARVLDKPLGFPNSISNWESGLVAKSKAIQIVDQWLLKQGF